MLLDVFMPRCNGLTVCHALLSRNPGARVVLMSGLSEGNHPFITGCKAAGFLHKPLSLQDVRQALETACDEGIPTGAERERRVFETAGQSADITSGG